jgi:uncharacterized protein
MSEIKRGTISMRRPLAFFVLALLPTITPLVAGQERARSPEEIRTLAERLVDSLTKHDFNAAVSRFDERMKTALPADKLEEVWRKIMEGAGTFKKSLWSHNERIQQYDAAFVTCEFQMAVLDVKIVFDSERRVTGLFFLPARPNSISSPLPDSISSPLPDSIREQAVTVGEGEWAVPGTLTLPASGNRLPAVVLVHGSGPNDRDEAIGPNRPFRDLAWGLAEKGIAVLRYDKRTKVHGAKLAATKVHITVKEETIDDALLAVSLLRTFPEIDAGRIFVLGHSLGGMLAPRIGKADPEIKGMIIMAGTTRPVEDVAVEQMIYIVSLDGKITEAEKARVEEFKAEAAMVKDPNLAAHEDSGDFPFGAPASYWLDLRGYNPAALAKELKQPLLFLQGERDYQVTMVDFGRWKEALDSHQNVEFKTYPKLNHLFMEGEGKSMPAEYLKPGTVASYVIEDISKWVSRQK